MLNFCVGVVGRFHSSTISPLGLLVACGCCGGAGGVVVVVLCVFLSSFPMMSIDLMM